MKTRIIILSTIILTMVGCSVEKKNDLTRDGLRGKVSSYKEFITDAWGHPEAKATYKYDEQGNMTEQITYRKQAFKTNFKDESKIEDKWTYKYDEQVNQTEVNRYKPDGTIDSKATYKYDAQGNMIEQITYGSNTKPLTSGWKQTYKYDEQGNQIEMKLSYDMNDYFNSKKIYNYDAQGNMIEQITYRNKRDEQDKHEIEDKWKLDRKYTYEYDEYDKNGNWTKRTEFRNTDPDQIKPESVTERVFEYYP
jgi:YD repeat-containing protein